MITESDASAIKRVCDTFNGNHLMGQQFIRCIYYMLENSRKNLPQFKNIDAMAMLKSFTHEMSDDVSTPRQNRELVIKIATYACVKCVTKGQDEQEVRSLVDQFLLEEKQFPMTGAG